MQYLKKHFLEGKYHSGCRLIFDFQFNNNNIGQNQFSFTPSSFNPGPQIGQNSIGVQKSSSKLVHILLRNGFDKSSQVCDPVTLKTRFLNFTEFLIKQQCFRSFPYLRFIISQAPFSIICFRRSQPGRQDHRPSWEGVSMQSVHEVFL